MMIFELIQALKFKISIPDSNLLTLINLILQVSFLTFKNYSVYIYSVLKIKYFILYRQIICF